MGLPSLFPPCLELPDEWKERGRMEDSEAASDNTVSSVTLTTAACTSNVLIMNFARKLAEACARASVAQIFCLRQSLLT